MRCTVEGCEREPDSCGMCSMHYKRWRRHGTTDPTRVVNAGVCTVEGCEKDARARGWCAVHYARWKRYGDPLAGNQWLGVTGDTLPAQPLLAQIERVGGFGDAIAAVGLTKECDDFKQLENAYRRMRERGRITPTAADQMSIQLFGVHPCFIYGDEWFTPELHEAATA